jgi:ABC-type Na+ efflux pump permease subunit
MDPEIRRQLEEIHALTKDNHRMLRTIRRHELINLISRVFTWIFVLILPLYIYQQYLYPMMEKLSPAGSVSTTGPFGLPTSADIEKLVNSYKEGTK